MIGADDIIKAIAAIVIAVLISYVLIMIAEGEPARTPSGSISVYETDPSPYDAHLTALDREALDEAYRRYRMELFAGWLKDPTKQPERAIFGAEKARVVYLRVIRAIDARPQPQK